MCEIPKKKVPYIDSIAKTWSITIDVDCRYIKTKQPNIGNIILEF